MAGHSVSHGASVFRARGETTWSVRTTVEQLLAPLASLRLTVVLFLLSIGLIFAGTLAQVDSDIWEVIDKYFRTWVTYIPLQVFLPPAFFSTTAPQVPGSLLYPGGKLIGVLLALNLLAAHGLRFKVQASGLRLKVGVAVLALGVVATWLVIASGSNKDGVQEEHLVSWGLLWNLFRLGLGGVWLAGAAALWRLDRQLRLERWLLLAFLVVLGGVLGYLIYERDAARFDDSSMRILWQLLKGGFAGLVLLIGSILVFKKRGGVVLLHGGIGLLMFGEFLVSTQVVETQMPIREGETAHFVQDIRTLELAITDTSNPEFDSVVVIPKQKLVDALEATKKSQQPAIIHDELLPFDIEVVDFLQNSELVPARPESPNPATAGIGQQFVAQPARASSGTDAGGEVDMSAIYVTLRKGKEKLGTYLLPLVMSAQNIPEKVTVDGKQYDLDLRFQRHYRPYAVTLIDVRKDDYLGTNTPRNYSSQLRLVDPTRNVDREVKIWMNNPLRFAGETFYQSGYHFDPRTRTESTTLQVMNNTGWMIPYVSCMLVGTGMLAHFGVMLTRFLKRRDAALEAPSAASAPTVRGATDPKRARHVPAARRTVEAPAAAPPSVWNWALPLVVVLAFSAYFASKARVPRAPADQMNLYQFGQLPLVYEGRVKPFDTLARNALSYLSGKQEYRDESGRKQPAIRWFLDLATGSPEAEKHRVFKIENLDVLQTLGLERRSGFLYAVGEFRDKAQVFNEQVELARKVDTHAMSLYQRKIVELDQRIRTYTLLQAAFDVAPLPPLPTEAEFQQDREGVSARLTKIKASLEQAQQTAQMLAAMQPPRAVPMQDARDGKEDWLAYSTAYVQNYLQHHVKHEASNPAVDSLTAIFSAYAESNPEAFNAAVKQYNELVQATPPPSVDPRKVRFEAYFNHFAPFYYAAVVYLIAGLLAVLAWLGFRVPLSRAALGLVLLTFAVHTFALVARMYISGRPPVTNLYSSAVFIGWGVVLMGIVLEFVYRLGIGTVMAGVAGFGTLLIAHFLAVDSDTFIVLQAVLDTQFWLATHVVCITLGYAATFAAGFLGLLYILRGVLSPSLSAATAKELSRMTYGIVCFAIFFSFVGTVLGGLWADDSWGRFWGWDPKENGALLIVLWNAVVLHAKFGAMVRDRGLAMLAVAGNIVTAWSWFGVNELGVGLHSYGFTEGVLPALGAFILSQLAVIGLAAIPVHRWWSARRGAWS